MTDLLIVIICGSIGLFLTGMNAVIIYQQIKQQSSSSWVPFLGGFCLFMALMSLPYNLPWYVKLLPFIIDWGCFPGLIHTFIYWAFIHPKVKQD